MVIGGQLQEKETTEKVKNMKAPKSTAALNKGKSFIPYAASHMAWNFCVEKIAELRAAKTACDKSTVNMSMETRPISGTIQPLPE